MNVRKLTTVDPNVGMAALARNRINQSLIEVDQQVLSGESFPFADHTFDCVVSTFTPCSIDGIDQALRDVYRVLKPGGQFFFLKHGLAPKQKVEQWQQHLNRLEMRLADGCRLNREIHGLVASRPFSALPTDEFYMPQFPKTHGYMSRGIATK